MNLEQKTSEYKPIEPESVLYNNIKKIYKKFPKDLFIGVFVGYFLFCVPLMTAITMNELQNRKTKQQVESEFKKSSINSKYLKKIIDISSKIPREFAYYLHEKNIKIKF